jgi:hypothetical protein
MYLFKDFSNSMFVLGAHITMDQANSDRLDAGFFIELCSLSSIIITEFLKYGAFVRYPTTDLKDPLHRNNPGWFYPRIDRTPISGHCLPGDLDHFSETRCDYKA